MEIPSFIQCSNALNNIHCITFQLNARSKVSGISWDKAISLAVSKLANVGPWLQEDVSYGNTINRNRGCLLKSKQSEVHSDFCRSDSLLYGISTTLMKQVDQPI